MKLYDLELSGNSYRVRLLLSLLGLKHEVVTVDLINDRKYRSSEVVNPHRSGGPQLHYNGCKISAPEEGQRRPVEAEGLEHVFDHRGTGHLRLHLRPAPEHQRQDRCQIAGLRLAGLDVA
jgi:hypothetical protein